MAVELPQGPRTEGLVTGQGELPKNLDSDLLAERDTGRGVAAPVDPGEQAPDRDVRSELVQLITDREVLTLARLGVDQFSVLDTGSVSHARSHYKFTGAPESIYIFETFGLEPWGRIGSGIAELVAVVLLLVPSTAVYGAALALAVMTGALAAHLTKLGLEVQGDGGLLFTLALVGAAGSLAILWLRRTELPSLPRPHRRPA